MREAFSFILQTGSLNNSRQNSSYRNKETSPPKVKHVDEEISLIVTTVEAIALRKHHWKMQRNEKLGTCLNKYEEHNPEKSLERFLFQVLAEIGLEQWGKKHFVLVLIMCLERLGIANLHNLQFCLLINSINFYAKSCAKLKTLSLENIGNGPIIIFLIQYLGFKYIIWKDTPKTNGTKMQWLSELICPILKSFATGIIFLLKSNIATQHIF